jgi:hypothetical protein
VSYVLIIVAPGDRSISMMEPKILISIKISFLARNLIRLCQRAKVIQRPLMLDGVGAVPIAVMHQITVGVLQTRQESCLQKTFAINAASVHPQESYPPHPSLLNALQILAAQDILRRDKDHSQAMITKIPTRKA